MRFELRQTLSGATVFDGEAGECFKSRHSAGREMEAVFFEPGVAQNPWRGPGFRLLELGFGLGTNFLHLLAKSEPMEFVSVERDLAGAEFFLAAEPNAALGALLRERAFAAAASAFRARLVVEDFFTALPRMKAAGEVFHCVYFDPFSPKANPEAWTSELFQLAYDLLAPGGRLVTYSVSRAAKDGALAAGFAVEKRDLPADLQKRSALLAVKAGGPA